MKRLKKKAIESKNKFIWSAGKNYAKELEYIGLFFLIIVTLSNIARKCFGFTLIPFFEITFDAFYNFTHYILHLFVFSWLTYFLKSIWYGTTLVFSLFLPIIPNWPKLVIPEVFSDLALVSIVLTRVFQSVDFIIPRKERADAENRMTPQLWNEIEKVEGPFWGFLHRVLDRINARIWNIIDLTNNIITYPIRKYPKLSLFIKRILITLSASVLMWGFIRLSGYVINVIAARHLNSPIMIVRKRFFRFFILYLIGAIVATVIFIITNGWLAEWTKPNLPITE